MSEQSKSLAVATIVPPAKTSPNGAHPVMGTKVLLSDGSELEGVTSVELKASVGTGVWHAVITVLPREIPAITADAQVVDVVEVDISDLNHGSHQYAQVQR